MTIIADRVTTWKTTCDECGYSVYYYPAKLLMEGPNPPIDMTKNKIVFLKCNYCEKDISCKFPKAFIQI